MQNRYVFVQIKRMFEQYEIAYFIMCSREMIPLKKNQSAKSFRSVSRRKALFSRDTVRSLSPVFIDRWTRLVLFADPRSFDISPTAFDYISARQLIRLSARFAQYGRARQGW